MKMSRENRKTGHNETEDYEIFKTRNRCYKRNKIDGLGLAGLLYRQLNKSVCDGSWNDLRLLSQDYFENLDSPSDSSLLLSERVKRRKKKRKTSLFKINSISFHRTQNLFSKCHKSPMKAGYSNAVIPSKASSNEWISVNQPISQYPCGEGLQKTHNNFEFTNVNTTETNTCLSPRHLSDDIVSDRDIIFSSQEECQIDSTDDFLTYQKHCKNLPSAHKSSDSTLRPTDNSSASFRCPVNSQCKDSVVNDCDDMGIDYSLGINISCYNANENAEKSDILSGSKACSSESFCYKSNVHNQQIFEIASENLEQVTDAKLMEFSTPEKADCQDRVSPIALKPVLSQFSDSSPLMSDLKGKSDSLEPINFCGKVSESHHSSVEALENRKISHTIVSDNFEGRENIVGKTPYLPLPFQETSDRPFLRSLKDLAANIIEKFKLNNSSGKSESPTNLKDLSTVSFSPSTPLEILPEGSEFSPKTSPVKVIRNEDSSEINTENRTSDNYVLRSSKKRFKPDVECTDCEQHQRTPSYNLRKRPARWTDASSSLQKVSRKLLSSDNLNLNRNDSKKVCNVELSDLVEDFEINTSGDSKSVYCEGTDKVYSGGTLKSVKENHCNAISSQKSSGDDCSPNKNNFESNSRDDSGNEDEQSFDGSDRSVNGSSDCSKSFDQSLLPSLHSESKHGETMECVVRVGEYDIDVGRIVSDVYMKYQLPSRFLKSVHRLESLLILNKDEMFSKIYNPHQEYLKKSQHHLDAAVAHSIEKRWFEFCKLHQFDVNRPNFFFWTPISRQYFSPIFSKYFTSFISRNLKFKCTDRKMMWYFQSVFGEEIKQKPYSSYDDAVILALHKKLGSDTKVKGFLNSIAAYHLKRSLQSVVMRYYKLCSPIKSSSATARNKKQIRSKMLEETCDSESQNSKVKNCTVSLQSDIDTVSIYRLRPSNEHSDSQRTLRTSSENSAEKPDPSVDDSSESEKKFDVLRGKSQNWLSILDSMLEVSCRPRRDINQLISDDLTVKDWRTVSSDVGMPAHVTKAIFQTKIHPWMFSSQAFNKYEVIGHVIS